MGKQREGGRKFQADKKNKRPDMTGTPTYEQTGVPPVIKFCFQLDRYKRGTERGTLGKNNSAFANGFLERLASKWSMMIFFSLGGCRFEIRLERKD